MLTITGVTVGDHEIQFKKSGFFDSIPEIVTVYPDMITIVTCLLTFITEPPECSPEGSVQNIEYCADGVTWKSRERCIAGKWHAEKKTCPEEPEEAPDYLIYVVIIAIVAIVIYFAMKRRK